MPLNFRTTQQRGDRARTALQELAKLAPRRRRRFSIAPQNLDEEAGEIQGQPDEAETGAFPAPGIEMDPDAQSLMTIGPRRTPLDRFMPRQQTFQNTAETMGPAPQAGGLEDFGASEEPPRAQARTSQPIGGIPSAAAGLETMGQRAPGPYQPPVPRGRDLASAIGRAGTPAARQAMEGSLDMGPAPGSLAYVRQEAMKGNPQAVKQLEFLTRNPAFGATMFGQAPWEQEATGAAEDRRQFDARLGEQQAGRYEKGRQFDAGQALRREEMDVDAKFKNTMAEINKQLAEGRIGLDQARLAADQAAQTASGDREQRKVAILERESAARLSPKPPDPYDREDRELGMRLKRAQVGVAEGQLAGKGTPAEEAANLRDANATAQGYADQWMSPDEAVSRAAKQHGVDPSKIMAPQISENPQAVRSGLTKLGMQDPDAAYKAALEKVTGEDPQFSGGIGSLGKSYAMENPQYKLAVKAKVVRNMIEMGVPANVAAKLVNERSR